MNQYSSKLKPSPAFLLILVTAVICQARQFYISPDGNDDNPGTSQLPWATVQKAADTCIAGDTAFIKPGTYEERLIPQNSGTQDAAIVFAAYAGDSVVLDGAGLGGQGVVYINGRQHIKIIGLHCINGTETGIWVINSSYITLYGNHTYNTVSSGIIVSEFGLNSDITIDSNEVELACNDGGQECISVSKCDGFIIRKNHIHHGGPGTQGGEGIDVKFGSRNGVVCYNYVHHLSRQGLYADAWTDSTFNIEFYGNIVHDCQFGIGVASEQGGALINVIFHNNLVYECPGPGMYILMADVPIRDLYFINNTIHHTGYEWCGGLWLNGPQAENVVVRNNIFSAMTWAPFSIQEAPASMTIDHNLSNRSEGLEPGWCTIGQAQFVDTTSGDFRLMPASPGIDAGNLSTVYDTGRGDLQGLPRVVDGDSDNVADIDMGAFEFQRGSSDVIFNGDYNIQEKRGFCKFICTGQSAGLLSSWKGSCPVEIFDNKGRLIRSFHGSAAELRRILLYLGSQVCVVRIGSDKRIKVFFIPVMR